MRQLPCARIREVVAAHGVACIRGLFDRAEAAYKALEGTAYHTEARLALLNLYERSRDWRAAVDVAQDALAAGGPVDGAPLRQTT